MTFCMFAVFYTLVALSPFVAVNRRTSNDIDSVWVNLNAVTINLKAKGRTVNCVTSRPGSNMSKKLVKNKKSLVYLNLCNVLKKCKSSNLGCWVTLLL